MVAPQGSVARSGEARGECRLIAAAKEEAGKPASLNIDGEGFIDHAIARELLGAEFRAAPARST